MKKIDLDSLFGAGGQVRKTRSSFLYQNYRERGYCEFHDLFVRTVTKHHKLQHSEINVTFDSRM